MSSLRPAQKYSDMSFLLATGSELHYLLPWQGVRLRQLCGRRDELFGKAVSRILGLILGIGPTQKPQAHL